jgi:cystine transport system permease protein
MSFNFALLLQSIPQLLKGLGFTVELALGSMFIGLALGFGLALMRLSKQTALRRTARIYVSFIRGTPLLVQLFMIYYGLPTIGIRLDPMTSGLIGFSLNMAAYSSEILRGAIAAVDIGQREAAFAMGMTPFQVMHRIVLPQAARLALPPLGNSFVSLVKDTSLAATIQVPELFRQAQLITARTFEVFTMYISVALVYWGASALLDLVQHRLEVRANRHLVAR